MSTLETMTAPGDDFDVAALLALGDADLRERLPFWARACYRAEPHMKDVQGHVLGVVARVAGRWPRGVRMRGLWDRPANTTLGPGVLHLICEVEFRRGPSNRAQLLSALAWFHGPISLDATRSLSVRDLDELRRLLRGWPNEPTRCRSGELVPFALPLSA